MADNYLEKRMEDYRNQQPTKRRVATLQRLLKANRSYRGYDSKFKVRPDQLHRIIETATLCPSARNQQVLRFRPVLSDEAAKVLKHIRLGGALPELNQKLAESNSNKQFRNLLGYTLGTGFGFGFVMDGHLNMGDNSCVETFCLKHRDHPEYIVEDGAAIRAVKRIYRELSGDERALEPYDIFNIAEGNMEGNSEAAKESFATQGRVAGDAMATAVTLMDGVIVIGGGGETEAEEAIVDEGYFE